VNIDNVHPQGKGMMAIPFVNAGVHALDILNFNGKTVK
jgi:hypothetical protein